jgi:hypothetical protein
MLKAEIMNHIESQSKSIGMMPFEMPNEIKLTEQVQLRNISAVYENQGVRIEWKAVTKGEDFIFIIERSDDGKLFEIIGISRCGYETINGEMYCQHLDEKPQINFPYYRIIYVEKSKVIFGKTCKMENFEAMVIEKMNNTAMMAPVKNQYIQ